MIIVIIIINYMSVKIRLARFGKKNQPFYRIVACDESAKRNGNFIEILGTYDPIPKISAVTLKNDRVAHWLKIGAQPSDTVRALLKKQNLL